MKIIEYFLRVVLWSVIFISSVTYATDPEQYGVPFTGVPDPRDAVIYQVNMRCFSSSRNFQGVIDRLDNIKSLGVNVIYLMPVFPVGTLKAFNSPYCIKDFTTVGPEFGTLDDLRNLIDGAHSRGMAVILDWVANHTSWDHPWITDHPDWYLQDISGNILSPPGQTWTDVAQLDFTNTDMCSEMIDEMRSWVFTVNCDGFRCDYANGQPVSFWTQAITSLRGITTHKLLLLAEGDRTANYTAGFDYIFGFQFYYNSIKPIYINGTTVKVIDNSNSAEYVNSSGTNQVVRYLSNHDVYGAEGSPFTIFNGKAGTMAAFVVTAYMKSVPFIYNGMEVGNTVSMPFPFTSTVIDWSEDPSVTTEMTKIIALRNNSDAIRRGKLSSYDNADICAFKKVSGSEAVFVVINLRNASKTFKLPTDIVNTTVYDEFKKDSVTLDSSLSLSAYQYLAYSYTSTAEAVDDIILNNSVIYPNPAEGLVNIKLKNEYKGAEIFIYDIQGHEVYRQILLIKENAIDISKLKKGFYIVKISYSDKVDNQILIVK